MRLKLGLMALLALVACGGEHSQDYQSAIEFFEVITGLSSRSDDKTYFGRLPTNVNKLAEDVSAWKAWWEKNGASLRSDPATGQLKRADDPA